MGAWGTGIFDNDDAGDFAASVVDDATIAPVEDIFDRILATTDYLEAPEASEGLAAADIVARLYGKPGIQNEYTKAIDDWVAKTKLIPSAALLKKARKTVTRVLAEPSELVELWSESDEFEAWKSTADDLLSRLS